MLERDKQPPGHPFSLSHEQGSAVFAIHPPRPPSPLLAGASSPIPSQPGTTPLANPARGCTLFLATTSSYYNNNNNKQRIIIIMPTTTTTCRRGSAAAKRHRRRAVGLGVLGRVFRLVWVFFFGGGGMAKGGALGPGFRGSGEEWGRGRSPAQPAAAARSPARQRRWLRAALGGWEAVWGGGGTTGRGGRDVGGRAWKTVQFSCERKENNQGGEGLW